MVESRDGRGPPPARWFFGSGHTIWPEASGPTGRSGFVTLIHSGEREIVAPSNLGTTATQSLCCRRRPSVWRKWVNHGHTHSFSSHLLVHVVYRCMYIRAQRVGDCHSFLYSSVRPPCIPPLPQTNIREPTNDDTIDRATSVPEWRCSKMLQN